jgi:hypothetical protein
MAARVVAIRNDQEIYCAQTDEEAQKLLAAADGMEMNEAHVRSIFTDESLRMRCGPRASLFHLYKTGLVQEF